MKTLTDPVQGKWIKQSHYSVPETMSRFRKALAAYPTVTIVAHLDQQETASWSQVTIRQAECLLIQNKALAGKLLSTNIRVGFELPFRIFCWETATGKVWIRSTDIDRLNEHYCLGGAEGTIDAIYDLLPGWLDYATGGLSSE